MDKLNQLKDSVELLNAHISKCEKMCNQIKKLLKFKGIKKKDVDIYFDGSDNCVVISYCLSEMNIQEALFIMETTGYITEQDFGY